MDRLSQEMARDLKEHNANISIVSIIPGLIQTESVVSAYESGNSVKLFGYDASLRMGKFYITNYFQVSYWMHLEIIWTLAKWLFVLSLKSTAVLTCNLTQYGT